MSNIESMIGGKDIDEGKAACSSLLFPAHDSIHHYHVTFPFFLQLAVHVLEKLSITMNVQEMVQRPSTTHRNPVSAAWRSVTPESQTNEHEAIRPSRELQAQQTGGVSPAHQHWSTDSPGRGRGIIGAVSSASCNAVPQRWSQGVRECKPSGIDRWVQR